MRYVLWSQQVLQEKNITYTKMTNYVDVEFKGIDLISHCVGYDVGVLCVGSIGRSKTDSTDSSV